MDWSYTQLRLQLLFTFKISRNASDFKTNYIIECHHEGIIGLGECAPNIRYGETLEHVEQQLQGFTQDNLFFETSISLYQYLSKAPFFQSVKNAIETAFLDYYAQKQQLKTHQLLHIECPPLAKSTMFTLPILEDAAIEPFYEEFKIYDYQQIKLKINKETATSTVRTLANIIGQRQLFIDANEAFPSLEEYLEFEKSIADINITFVEQPLPASHIEDYIKLKSISKWPIFGDESIISHPDMALIAQQFHGVNVKMMKAGGYLESVSILKKAKHLGLQTMIGCMVETSLGISHAFEISALADYLDLDSFLYLKDEPFQMIKQEYGRLSL